MREAAEEGPVSRQQTESRADRDTTGSRKRRLHALKGLVAVRGYDVPAEDVAASIIRDALVIAAPTPHR